MEEHKTEKELALQGANLILDYHIRERGDKGDINLLATTGDLTPPLTVSVGEYLNLGIQYIAQSNPTGVLPAQLCDIMHTLAIAVDLLHDVAIQRTISTKEEG